MTATSSMQRLWLVALCLLAASEADRLLLESLSGPDDPGFFTVIEWRMNRPEW